MRLAALIEAPGHVSARYRVEAFAGCLERAGCALTLQTIPRGALARIRLFTRLRGFDAVLLQRQLLAVPELLYLRRMVRRLIYDFDDAMLYRDSYHPRGLHSRQRIRRFTAIVGAADTVIAGNQFLRQCALNCGARAQAVRVIPTCIQPEKYPPRRTQPRPDGVELVWIGSSSTLSGLELQRPLLANLARAIPGLRLRLICDRFARFDPLPVIATPWQETSEASYLAEADVGISWIPDDAWSRGKCGLKLLQYGAAGLPAIANPAGVHSEIIEHGVTGFLAADEDQWIAALRQLAASPAMRREMGEQARARVEQRYAVAANAAAFTSAVLGF